MGSRSRAAANDAASAWKLHYALFLSDSADMLLMCAKLRLFRLSCLASACAVGACGAALSTIYENISCSTMRVTCDIACGGL